MHKKPTVQVWLVFVRLLQKWCMEWAAKCDLCTYFHSSVRRSMLFSRSLLTLELWQTTQKVQKVTAIIGDQIDRWTRDKCIPAC